MGSRNLQFEILVLPENQRENHNVNSTSSQNQNVIYNINNNPPPQQQVRYETKVQKFKCSQENLLAYWIPDGFRAVLMPKKDLHLVQQPQQQLSNNLPSSPANNAQQNSHVIRTASVFRRRNNPMGNGRPMRQITALDIYYLQSRKSSPNGSALPVKTVFDMWHAEPEDVKRKYKRLALRQRIELGLRYNNTSRPPLKSQLMMKSNSASSGFPQNMQTPAYDLNNTTMSSNIMKENMQQQNCRTRFYNYGERTVPVRQDSSASSESEEDSDDAFYAIRNNHHVPSSYASDNEENSNDLL
ncbi:6774_t:CDS:1 [Ambispora gerdemannii]|uniref:6774_t:CDS:1 n=1 Tax=Ambispora gerdemannii TaxID=144530 RepID=A0A9N8ZT94_9GLOM|nr:6774_t:CDS:1 [Ambispora gerdemannii]